MLLSESLEDGTATNRDEIVNHMRFALMTNNEYLEKAILRLYKYQTEYEQKLQTTAMFNGVGFNGRDAKLLSSLAEWLKRGRHLTEKQRYVARKKLAKYASQLVNTYIAAGVIQHVGRGQWRWIPKAERDRLKAASQKIRDAETAKFAKTKFEAPTSQLELFK